MVFAGPIPHSTLIAICNISPPKLPLRHPIKEREQRSVVNHAKSFFGGGEEGTIKCKWLKVKASSFPDFQLYFLRMLYSWS